MGGWVIGLSWVGLVGEKTNIVVSPTCPCDEAMAKRGNPSVVTEVRIWVPGVLVRGGLRGQPKTVEMDYDKVGGLVGLTRSRFVVGVRSLQA